MNTVVDDLRYYMLTLTQAVNTALNWPLWRLLSMSERGSELATLEAAVYE